MQLHWGGLALEGIQIQALHPLNGAGSARECQHSANGSAPRENNIDYLTCICNLQSYRLLPIAPTKARAPPATCIPACRVNIAFQPTPGIWLFSRSPSAFFHLFVRPVSTAVPSFLLFPVCICIRHVQSPAAGASFATALSPNRCISSFSAVDLVALHLAPTLLPSSFPLHAARYYFFTRRLLPVCFFST